MNPIPGTPEFRFLFGYKIASTFVQLYLLYLITTNISASEPFLSLKTIAHFGGLVAGLRGMDALIDPMLQHLDPFKGKRLSQDDKDLIASETSDMKSATANINKIIN